MWLKNLEVLALETPLAAAYNKSEVSFTEKLLFLTQWLANSARVRRYILATECAIATLPHLLYSPKIEEYANITNSIFDFSGKWMVFLCMVTILKAKKAF